MHSSTSSFERPVPDKLWLKILGIALLICFVCIAAMEIRLAQLGYHPTVLDSKDRWIDERLRASKLGKRALILIGASRIQLGMDLDVLRNETGLEPIQLAIDASSFVPILKGLADDPSIRGTILVDYYPQSVEGALTDDYGSASAMVDAFQKHSGRKLEFSLVRTEETLSRFIHENLRSFADGANPLQSLSQRIIPGKPANKYLITRPDRSRLADYTLLEMPKSYYARVAGYLGIKRKIDLTAPDIEQILTHHIGMVRSNDNAAYRQGARLVGQLAASINSRGGRVIFVAMPATGMVQEIDERRYPRADFLDLFEKESGSRLINAADEPYLRVFNCPDGSHLDFRDRPKFTSALAHLLEHDRNRTGAPSE